MYIVLLSYIKPIEEVERWIDLHIEFLDKYYEEGLFIFSGRRDPRTGGVILVNTDSEEKIQQIIREDPFHQNEIALYDTVKFTPTKYDPKFHEFVN